MTEDQFPHKLTLNERKHLTMTGVTEVVSFDETAVVLQTGLGLLRVQGQDLKLKTLSLEGGQVAVEGSISALVYEEPRESGLWQRLRRCPQPRPSGVWPAVFCWAAVWDFCTDSCILRSAGTGCFRMRCFPWLRYGAGSISALPSAGETSVPFTCWRWAPVFCSGTAPAVPGCSLYFPDSGPFWGGFSGFFWLPGKKFWKLQKFCLHLRKNGLQ